MEGNVLILENNNESGVIVVPKDLIAYFECSLCHDSEYRDVDKYGKPRHSICSHYWGFTLYVKITDNEYENQSRTVTHGISDYYEAMALIEELKSIIVENANGRNSNPSC